MGKKKPEEGKETKKKTKEPKAEAPVAEAAEAAPETETEEADEMSAKLREAEEKLADAEKNAAADKDRYLRLAAEYDNFRKRSQKEREGVYNDAVCDTVKKLLPVYDNLARALTHGTEDKAFLKGVEMTMTQLEEIFGKLGVKPIEAVGHPFDAALHEAVMHREDPDAGENAVVQEFEKGFQLGDKVIRYSKVVVAN